MAEAAGGGAGQAALRLEVDEGGVAWLVFDNPDGKANILTTPVMERLGALLEEVSAGVVAGRIRGVVVASGKSGMFIAGANIEEIAGVTDPADGEAKARAGQELFRRIEELDATSVAAIDGTCLGGGLELALACDVRLASDSPRTRLGFPEVRLGILPGFGGTVRMPRVVGLQAALDLILTGRTIDARRAEKIGLVHERVPAAVLRDRARQLALSGDRPQRRRRPLLQRALDETPIGRRVVLAQARKRVLKETRGHYPAPLAILDTVRDTLGRPLEPALRREAAALGRLIATDVSKNLIHVYYLLESAKKSGPDVPPQEVERAAVLGAGVMGGGIAQLLAAAEIPVRLKDVKPEALGQGLRHARSIFEKAVKRRRLGRTEAERLLGQITPTLDYTGFGHADVVVEAVVERMDVKKQVLREAEERVGAACVLASNTSSLSITEMQSALARPERFCGMHFFNPVHRMPLVEVIRGQRTSDETVATIVALSRRLDKTPLIVKDGAGFLVNRLLAPYLNEAGWLLADGASIESIDEAMLDFGMPMGPLRLMDEIGLDVARHAGTVMHEAFGDRLRPAPPLEAIESTDRLGRKGGRGFYVYENGEATGPDQELERELRGMAPREIPAEEIQDRCVLAMVNEAARALEDGIVDGAGEVDLGMITGTGFPPFRGGLLRYADARGTPAVLQRLERLAGDAGPRFEPAPLLRRLADQGRGFYG